MRSEQSDVYAILFLPCDGREIFYNRRSAQVKYIKNNMKREYSSEEAK